MKNVIEEIKKRKIRKWIAIYLSTAITTVGIVHLLSLRYSWPDYIFDFVFFTLLFGLATTLIISWYRGEVGPQKVKVSEIVLHSIIIILLLVTLFFQIDFGKKKNKKSNKQVVAVLPFTNFNETKENEVFADGITDDILTQISKISNLRVISRTSIMKYKNTKMNISEISEELGAGTILEGSVRTYGNKIRIVSQLIDASNDVHIWSETYDRELEDIFEIQSEIAERIAAALHTKLLPIEKKLITEKSTENIEAYTYYLRGKHHYFNFNKDDNEKAIKFFNKALQVDSNYALALAGLSEAISQKVSKYWEPDSLLDSSLVLSKRAVKLNSSLPQAYKALASVYHAKGEYELAQNNYQTAIDLNPNYWDAILNYGQIKMFIGEHDEALYWLRKANELAPDNILGHISLSMVYRNLDCPNTAIYWAEKALSIEPENNFAISNLGELYLNKGDFTNAEKYFELSVKMDSNWIFAWFLGARIEVIKENFLKAKGYFDKYLAITKTQPEYYYAYILMQLDQTDSANVILNEEVNDYKEYLSDVKYPQTFNYMAFAEIYALTNNKEDSFKQWNKAINKGYTDINRLKLFPYFKNLKTDPQYNILMKKMQTKIDSFKTEVKNKYPNYFDCN